jgi:hypothetical protein
MVELIGYAVLWSAAGIDDVVETFYKTANTATNFVNAYVTVGTKYYYYVTALNSSGSSAASNEASATP